MLMTDYTTINIYRLYYNPYFLQTKPIFYSVEIVRGKAYFSAGFAWGSILCLLASGG
jgi:hypothetical protein